MSAVLDPVQPVTGLRSCEACGEEPIDFSLTVTAPADVAATEPPQTMCSGCTALAAASYVQRGWAITTEHVA